MGLLVDGQWQDKWYDTKSTGGRFKRSESQFRNWVTADGSAGSSGDSGFQAESEIGRASCRERVEISVVAVSLKKKKIKSIYG